MEIKRRRFHDNRGAPLNIFGPWLEPVIAVTRRMDKHTFRCTLGHGPPPRRQRLSDQGFLRLKRRGSTVVITPCGSRGVLAAAMTLSYSGYSAIRTGSFDFKNSGGEQDKIDLSAYGISSFSALNIHNDVSHLFYHGAR